MNLRLYNTLSKEIEWFTPLNKQNITMYVCGPTVYDRPHIGNARSTVTYDILFRVLKHIYGKSKVTYVRNITDVDDKIITAANNQKITASNLTSKIYDGFKKDMSFLGCQSPVIEPKATEHIKHMINLIQRLLDNSCAYIANNHVYFDITKYSDYNELSGRSFEEAEAGYRIEISQNKRNTGDFVLWKPPEESDGPDTYFDSPWGVGRPGWHIECSAMSSEYLGDTFDIHGGGIDLVFPHHTNEIAQSVCANPDSQYARYWVHNGFLTVNGEKMSKSLGNFITVNDLKKFDDINGESIRLFFLLTHYRKPLNWTKKGLDDAAKSLSYFSRTVKKVSEETELKKYKVDPLFLEHLNEDLNTPKAIARLHEMAKECNSSKSQKEKIDLANTITKSANLIGLLQHHTSTSKDDMSVSEEIERLIIKRSEAKKNKNWELADSIRNELKERNIVLEDTLDGKTSWRSN
ncbi:MAG: cysteine--tRNA ligase [Rickettsiales bacterium]